MLLVKAKHSYTIRLPLSRAVGFQLGVFYLSGCDPTNGKNRTMFCVIKQDVKSSQYHYACVLKIHGKEYRLGVKMLSRYKFKTVHFIGCLLQNLVFKKPTVTPYHQHAYVW